VSSRRASTPPTDTCTVREMPSRRISEFATRTRRRSAASTRPTSSDGFHKDREFLPAPARQYVAGAHGSPESRGYADQHGIPKDVPEFVVDVFEMIEIGDEQAEQRAVACQVLEAPGQRGVNSRRFGNPVSSSVRASRRARAASAETRTDAVSSEKTSTPPMIRPSRVTVRHGLGERAGRMAQRSPLGVDVPEDVVKAVSSHHHARVVAGNLLRPLVPVSDLPIRVHQIDA
jgi:hypothetical protein